MGMPKSVRKLIWSGLVLFVAPPPFKKLAFAAVVSNLASLVLNKEGKAAKR